MVSESEVPPIGVPTPAGTGGMSKELPEAVATAALSIDWNDCLLATRLVTGDEGGDVSAAVL